MVEDTFVLGVRVEKDSFHFIEPDKRTLSQATEKDFIVEFLELFSEVGVQDCSFSYNVKGGKIVPEFQPKELGYTCVGQLMKGVDDYLKEVLIDLRAIEFGEKIYLKTKGNSSTSITYDLEPTTIMGVNIVGDDVKFIKTTDAIIFDSMSLKLNTWYSTMDGGTKPFSRNQMTFIDFYQRDSISNFSRYIGHPFWVLKKVLMAQHIAQYIIEQTGGKFGPFKRLYDEDKSVPIVLRKMDLGTIIADESTLMIKAHTSENWHKFSPDGYSIDDSGKTYHSPRTATWESLATGGILSPKIDFSRYGMRRLTDAEAKSGKGLPSVRFEYFSDDPKECVWEKYKFNSAVESSESFTHDDDDLPGYGLALLVREIQRQYC